MASIVVKYKFSRFDGTGGEQYVSALEARITQLLSLTKVDEIGGGHNFPRLGF